jgi:hypothetical protein
VTQVTNVPDSFELTEDDVFALAISIAVLDAFPGEIGFDSHFSRNMLLEAIASKKISQEGLLAAAFFGLMPIPSTTKRLTTLADRFYRTRGIEWHASPKVREDRYARFWGMTRRDMKGLLAVLDNMARDRGFADFGSIFYADGSPPGEKTSGFSSIRYRTWIGPRYLWEIKERVARHPHPNLEIKACGLWLCVLVRSDETVVGHAFPPMALRIGDGRSACPVDPRDWNLEDPNARRLFRVPDYIRDELASLASTRFAGLPYEFHEPATVGDIKAIVTGSVSQ